MFLPNQSSRTQSLQAFWSAGQRREDSGHQILLPQDFCGKTIETVTEQPIKKIEFFRCPQSLPGVAPLTKKPEDSGYEIVSRVKERTADRLAEIERVPNRWACAIDSGLLPAIRFSKWRTTNQNNTRHSKGRNAAVLALRTSEFYIIVRQLWSIS